MNKKLEYAFKALIFEHTTLIKKIQDLPQELLTTPPAPGKWSAFQILLHLYTSELLSIGYIKKKSMGIESLKNAGLWQSFLMIILKISQRFPFRYKAPKAVLQNTPSNLTLTELLARWEQLRMELKSMLAAIPDKNVDKLVFKHPVVGRLSLPQALLFFIEHIKHHEPQLDKILNAKKN